MVQAIYSTKTETKRKRLDAMWSQLYQERETFIPHWRDLSDFILPWRSRFLTNQNNKGDRVTKKIIDSTGTYANGVLAAGLMSGITNPAQEWFTLTTPDPELAEVGSVKQWLHEVQQLMYSQLLRSNFYDSASVVYEDCSCFGTAAMLVEEDFENTLYTEVLAVGSYMIGNDSKGRVHLFAREFRLTVRQIVEDFATDQDGNIDWSKCSQHVHDQWESGQRETWVDVRHVVYPNDEYDPRRLGSKYKKYASCYYEVGSSSHSKNYNVGDTYLREKGYDYFPVLVARWSVKDGDVYGTSSPGMVALGDIKQLQLMEKRALQAVEKMVNPPMNAPSEMFNKKASILPGDINYYDLRQGGQRFEPVYQVSMDLNHLELKEQQARQRIHQNFFVNVILMMESAEKRQMTATEVDERKREKLLALGRVLQRFEREFLNLLIDIMFTIMERQGMIPEPPAELEGMTLKVEYQSLMAQAQKLSGISGIERFAAFAQSLASVNPSVLDKVDFDELVDEYARKSGMPPRVVVPDEDVVEIRRARAQAQQAQAAVTAARETAGAMKEMSQAKMDEDSALSRLLEQSSAGSIVGSAA